MAYGCATFTRRVIQYTTPDKLKSSRRTGKQLVSFFMYIVCRYPLEQGGIENRDFKNVLPWEALQRLQLPKRLSVIEFHFYDFFLPLLV